MNDKEKRTSPKWLEKLKKVKHIEIYIAVVFVIILLLIYLSNFKSSDVTNEEIFTNEMSVTSYIDKLENDLEEILTNIGGVSNVKVLITLDMDQAEVTDSLINLNKFPNIKGVLVTANGVNDVSKKLKVLHAIESVIDIDDGNIQILSSD